MPSAYKIEKELQKLLLEIGDKAAKDTAIELAENTHRAYMSVIKEFYNDYAPTSYDRGYNLFSASPMFGKHRTASRLVKPMVGGGYSMTFDVRGENIKGQPYKNWVISENNGDVDKKYKYQLKTIPASNSEVLYTTFNLGLHGKLLPFSPTLPHKTTPSPKARMDKRFSEIKGSVKNTISKHINKYIRMYTR